MSTSSTTSEYLGVVGRILVGELGTGDGLRRVAADAPVQGGQTVEHPRARLLINQTKLHTYSTANYSNATKITVSSKCVL